MKKQKEGSKILKALRIVIKKITSRFFLLALFSFIQLAAFVLLGIYALSTEFGGFVFLAFYAIDVIVSIIILNGSTASNYKTAWIIEILLLPTGSGVIFWLIFANKRTAKMNDKIKKSYVNVISKNNMGENYKNELEEIDIRAYLTSTLIYKSTKSAVFKNSEVTYYDLGQKVWQPMLDEIAKAKRFIFIEYFIIEEGKFFNSILDLLKQKQSEGVDIRVMYDDFGCLNKIPVNYHKYLEKLGFKVHVFHRLPVVLSPKTNNRDHRKLLIIDGVVGFTGGMNLADEYVNEVKKFGADLWKDNCMRIKGPAVYGMTSLFLSNWDRQFGIEENFERFSYNANSELLTDELNTSGYIQPYGDIPFDFDSAGERAYISLISKAKDYVYICSPYIILSDNIFEAIKEASMSGVDVRIVIPEIPDKKLAYQLTIKYCEKVMKYGVKIYKYKDSFIHSKVVLSDDEYGICGTINLDNRSLFLHMENGVFLYKNDALKDIKNDFNNMFENSISYNYGNIKKKGIFKKMWLSIIEVLAPLF